MTAPDSWLRFTWRLISPSGSLAPATPRKALPVPQNRVLHNGLQGITFDDFSLHNEMLGHRD